MKRILSERITAAESLASEAARSNAALGIFRVLMQHMLLGLYEWSVAAIRVAVSRPEGVELPIGEARRPTDGGMVTAVSELLVTAENLGWKNITNAWWEVVEGQRPCWRLLDGGRRNVDNLLTSFVRRRNDGLGHGLPGNYDSEADFDLLRLVLEKMGHVIPEFLPVTNRLIVTGGGRSAELQSLRLVDGNPLLLRGLKSLGGGRARATAQVLVPTGPVCDHKFECDDVLGLVPPREVDSMHFISTHDANWNPLGRVPDKATLEFAGREQEMIRLANWFDDAGSRACLMFGDGGVGKTTLLIEFLHRLLSGKVPCEWRPEAIFYYTAKQTQWTVDGIRYIGVPRKGLADALRSIPASIEGALSRDWYSVDITGLSSKVGALLSDLGISRERALLVVDNAETLATNDVEVEVLAEELNSVVRRVGRVLLTSRRLERLEAKPIQIEALLEDDALMMLRARGDALSRRQISDAGDSTLRGYARKLGRKPISLEVFVSAVEPGASLDHAFNRVMRLQESELGEFLFADAWQRMSQQVRVLLLIMTRVSDVHDEVLLKLACQEASVSVREAEEALRESLGIATVTKASGHLSIAFSDDFVRYCTDRYETIGNERCPTDVACERVRNRYATYLKGVNAQLPSKDARAFRHATARAAYAAAADGRVDDAIIFFEEAVIADAENAFLWDRYGYYLFKQRRFPEALDKSIRAARLLPKDPSILFTRGMIEAKLGDVVNANSTLGDAIDNGALPHRCWLAKAYAYFNAPGNNFEQVEHCLQAAKSTCPQHAYQRLKHFAEVDRLYSRLARERKRARA